MVQVSLSEAKTRLHELVRRAEAGEEIVLTRRGTAVAYIEPARAISLPSKMPLLSPEERMAVIRRAQKLCRGKFKPGDSAARSQDFLYDADGLPD